MKTIKNLRTNHEQLLIDKSDTTGIYKGYYAETLKQVAHLQTLLKDTDCVLTLQEVTKHSWFDHEIICEIYGHKFIIAEDSYRKIVLVRMPAQYEYIKQTSLTYSDVKDTQGNELKSPLNYKFYKLTTKKLLSILEYDVAVFNNIKAKVAKETITNKELFEQAVNKITFISDVLGSGLQNNSNNAEATVKTVYCYAQHKLCEASLTDNNVLTISTDVEYIYETIMATKKHFSQR